MDPVPAIGLAPMDGLVTACSMFLHRHYVVLQNLDDSRGFHLQATMLDPVSTRGTNIYLVLSNGRRGDMLPPSRAGTLAGDIRRRLALDLGGKGGDSGCGDIMDLLMTYRKCCVFDRTLNLFFILTLSAAPTYAIDGVSFAAGSSFGTNEVPTDMVRVGVQWEWGENWRISDHWSFSGYWEASLGYWHTNDHRNDYQVVDYGLTPVFRLQRADAVFGVIPYVEFAIGAHLLSGKDISDGNHFSTSFQFGDQIALGFRFGAHDRYDLSFCMQHLSNAGIDNPNPGINFNQLRFQYHL